MVKTLKNLPLRNQKADDLETSYAALGARSLLSLFKWWPKVDHDLFYGKVKFGPLLFCTGKGKTMDFSETVVVSDLKLATDDPSDKFFLTSNFVPWGLCAPCPGVIYLY